MTTRSTLAERISIASDINAERLAGLAQLEATNAHREASAKPCRRLRRQAARFVHQEDNCTPIDRNVRAKILMVAEGLERRTKAPGKKNGSLGYTGLIVL